MSWDRTRTPARCWMPLRSLRPRPATRASAARARLLRLRLELASTPGPDWAVRALTEADRDIPIFEAVNDPAGASTAWRVRYVAHGTTGLLGEAATDAERVIELRHSGRRRAAATARRLEPGDRPDLRPDAGERGRGAACAPRQPRWAPTARRGSCSRQRWRSCSRCVASSPRRGTWWSRPEPWPRTFPSQCWSLSLHSMSRRSSSAQLSQSGRRRPSARRSWNS